MKTIKMGDQQKYMEIAAGIAEENVANGGGPFGALIVRDEKVIATGRNQVTGKNDPTAHAEIEAIRKATTLLET